MNYLGLDYGQKRVGVSIFYDILEIVLPKQAILASDENIKIEKICQLVKEYSIDEIVIGYPLNMDGSVGSKAKEVETFTEKLKKFLPPKVKIHYADERLTSEQANHDLRQSQGRRSIKRTRKQRASGMVDSQAAVIILQNFIEERNLNTNI